MCPDKGGLSVLSKRKGLVGIYFHSKFGHPYRHLVRVQHSNLHIRMGV